MEIFTINYQFNIQPSHNLSYISLCLITAVLISENFLETHTNLSNSVTITIFVQKVTRFFLDSIEITEPLVQTYLDE